MLFFQDSGEPPESVCHGFLLHQLWLRLGVIMLCGSPSKYFSQQNN
jgi:hypothetical protein